MKVGDRVRLTVSIRTWDLTLWPKGAVCTVLDVRSNGLRLRSNKKIIRGVPLDAIEKEKP